MHLELKTLMMRVEDLIETDNITSYQHIKAVLGREFGTKEFEKNKDSVRARVLEAGNRSLAQKPMESEGTSVAVDVSRYILQAFR